MTMTDLNDPVAPTDHDEVIRLLEETLRIEKRVVESGRVRVSVSVSERDEMVEIPLVRRDLTVERVPVGHQVDVVPQSRIEGDILIVPVVEEVAVVVKQLFLREELHIRVNRTTHVDAQTVRLRREHAQIDLDGAAAEVTNHRSDP